MKNFSIPLLVRACRHQPVERPPVWIMRQAGRYLPQYQAVRKKTSFLGLCKTPELAAKVTLQPLEFLDVDAAIIFSDILIVPEAMGQGLQFKEKEGPKLFPAVRKEIDVRKLEKPKPEKAYAFLAETLRLVRQNLSPEKALIGFAGAPWTLLTYMVEGGASKNFINAKRLIYETPRLAHRLLKLLAKAVADLLNFQIENGAQVVQIFDTWAGVLSPHDFEAFAMGYVSEVIQQIQKTKVPVIYFPKGRGDLLAQIISCGADVIGLDWTVGLSWAQKIAKGRVALQGNLDPVLLLSPPALIRKKVLELLDAIDSSKNYIFNLGHGILPETPPHHAKILVETVKSCRKL